MSFFEPVALRKKLEKLPEGASGTEAPAIMDALDRLAQQYDDDAYATMSAYIADMEKWPATDLIGVLQPLDRKRKQTLAELVRLRQRLVDALSPEEWNKVFD